MQKTQIFQLIKKQIEFDYNLSENGDFIFNKIDDYKELVNIREKYQTLLPQVDRIDSLMTENIELRKQLEAMKNNVKDINNGDNEQ